ncbi:MAG: sel1 repeat family protein [Parachlamydia sp.]|nr:sel1 repeat family protein [Parachlamydia sp.]
MNPKVPVVVCDANVLYVAVLRDLLMWLASDLLYKAHWTDAIQKEWTTNLLNNNSEIKWQNKGFHYLKLAADKGLALAQSLVGYLYEMGNGVEKSLFDAKAYYRLAADQGDPISQFNLGELLESAESLSYFEKSAHQGYALAQFKAGYYYQQGFLPKNLSKKP